MDGIVRALAFPGRGFAAFNLGNHFPITLAELVATLGSLLGVEPQLDRQPEQPGDVPRTWANIDQARRLLDWQPRTSLVDGLNAYRAWLGDAPRRMKTAP